MIPGPGPSLFPYRKERGLAAALAPGPRLVNGRSYAGGSDTEILNEPFTVAQKGTSQGEISGDVPELR